MMGITKGVGDVKAAETPGIPVAIDIDIPTVV
jgi:hypothetical protein